MGRITLKNCPLHKMKHKLTTGFHNNSSILSECALINLKRIYYLAFIVIPMRILNIFLFKRTTPESNIWGEGIIISHFIILIFWVGVLLISHKSKHKTKPTSTINILQYVVAIFTMATGVVIATIDQLVTTNITPLLLVSIVVGAIFLIRPLISVIIYLISFIAYYYSIGITINDNQILLSNRVNGITAIAIGLLISIMIWHYTYTNIIQRRRIEKQQRQLKQMAYYDQLTSLCNRYYFNKVVEKEFYAVERYGHESVIIIMDIDEFKNINDTYGHRVGDELLRELAQLIDENIRASDTASRFGGEEFIILAPKVSLKEGAALAEKLREIVAEHEFKIDTTTIRITASFGVSLLQSTETQRLDNYFSLADKALYSAKEKGKNRVEMILREGLQKQSV